MQTGGEMDREGKASQESRHLPRYFPPYLRLCVTATYEPFIESDPRFIGAFLVIIKELVTDDWGEGQDYHGLVSRTHSSWSPAFTRYPRFEQALREIKDCGEITRELKINILDILDSLIGRFELLNPSLKEKLSGKIEKWRAVREAVAGLKKRGEILETRESQKWYRKFDNADRIVDRIEKDMHKTIKEGTPMSMATIGVRDSWIEVLGYGKFAEEIKADKKGVMKRKYRKTHRAAIGIYANLEQIDYETARSRYREARRTHT
jgi:Txe/YoeB family toxin of Txe-Axe toxin-antitoxin module